jgi:hypothetical protein
VNLAAVTFWCCTLATGQTPALTNLGLEQRSLTGWEGDGFYLTTASARGASAAVGVCSSDSGNPKRKAMLRRVFIVPEGAGEIHFRAYAARGKNCAADHRLNVLLLGSGNRVIPKRVRTTAGWEQQGQLLPRADGRAREYCWDVSRLAGQTLQIAVVDQDDRPGCHVWCAGFRVKRVDDSQQREFTRYILALQRDHKLAPVARYETRHFTAWSNADEDFTAIRLRHCEILYDAFFTHFARKGFRLERPAGRMMVAVFDSQAGFEAYLGRKMPAGVMGIYHPKTNRLVVYDVNQNSAFIATQRKAQDLSRTITLDMDRIQYLDGVTRTLRDHAKDLNVGATMHEVAHQLSFNCGMLNRHGDVPVWLGEGLACYCEATDHGSWQGIGEPNPERLRALAVQLRGGGHLIPLKDLIETDHWRNLSGWSLVGYAQSWALFRMLMEEQPEKLRRYLTLIWPRRAPDHRLTDFQQAFGGDLNRLEQRYRTYLEALVERNVPR